MGGVSGRQRQASVRLRTYAKLPADELAKLDAE
jgi:hypothetical protein